MIKTTHKADTIREKVRIDLRGESRALIKTWAPGQKAEDFVVSAFIEAVKPVSPDDN